MPTASRILAQPGLARGGKPRGVRVGTVDFDRAGQTVGAFEIWCMRDTAGTRSFAQTQVLPARALQPLAD